MENRLPLPQIIIIISTIISLIIVFANGWANYKGDGTMTEVIFGGIVALVVAIIGAAAGIWMQVIQMKRDSGKINGVGDKVGAVKSDTSEIKPQVLNIQLDVRKIRDDVVEKVVPSMSKMGGIDKLVEEMNYQKRIKSETMGNLMHQDILLQNITVLYETNAKLSNLVHEKEKENTELKNKVSSLSYNLELANRELEKYRPRHQDLGPER